MHPLLHFVPVASALLYILATLLYIAAILRDRPASLARYSLLLGFWLHVVFLVLCSLGFYSFKNELPAPQSLPLMLSIISCILVGFYILLEERLGITTLGALVAPVGLGFMLLSKYLFHFTPTHPLALPSTTFGGAVGIGVHIVCVVIACSLFAFAFGVSVALIVQERLLKNHRFGAYFNRFPSLLLLDRLNVALLKFGFWMMAIGIGIGLLYSLARNLELTSSDPRVIWSYGVLALYALVLFIRARYGWRGRRTAWLAVFGFCALLASFFSAHQLSLSFHVY